MFWRHSFRNKLIKEVCIEYMSTFVADASVFSFTFKIVQVCFPLPLCLFFYICTCFVFWIAISLVFWEKWFVKTWKWVTKRESQIAIWNPVTEKAFVPLPLLALKKFLKSISPCYAMARIFNSLITLFIYGMKMKKKTNIWLTLLRST